jgi:hypothetical protein
MTNTNILETREQTEGVWKLPKGGFFHMQESSEGGWDFTAYDAGMHEIDGGICDDEELSFEEALPACLDMLDVLALNGNEKDAITGGKEALTDEELNAFFDRLEHYGKYIVEKEKEKAEKALLTRLELPEKPDIPEGKALYIATFSGITRISKVMTDRGRTMYRVQESSYSSRSGGGWYSDHETCANIVCGYHYYGVQHGYSIGVYSSADEAIKANRDKLVKYYENEKLVWYAQYGQELDSADGFIRQIKSKKSFICFRDEA